jgi:ring-1,2-phenylacetyl-CoA epoxidase subunit PaaE
MLKFHPLRVLAVGAECEDAVTIALEVPSALAAEYRGRAGQHVVLRAELGGAEVRRTYSLLNAPGEWPLRIAPRIHAHGTMSGYLAHDLRAGDTLDVLPPNGSFTPAEPPAAGATYVAFAAGCGVTPVVSIARTLLERSDARVILFYGNATAARTMCLEELQALKDRHMARLALHFLMSREPQEAALYNGRLDAPRVRELAARFFAPDVVQEYFVCGPGDMIEALGGALAALGVESARVHGEHFTTAGLAPAPVAAPEPESAAAPAPGSAEAQVTVRMDGRRRTFGMKMDGETVLDAAARAGIELPFSCRAGVCSTCRTKVLAGTVEMAQNYALEDWEVQDGYILACQSRVTSRELELDYDEK